MSVELKILPFKVERGERFLSYDDRLHQAIITTDTYGLGFVYLDDPQAKRNRFSSDKPILDAKFSHNIKYSAIKFSDNEMEIFHSETGVRSLHSCKNKGSVILGFYWTNSDNLLVITNTSIELYQMVDGVCKLIKELKNLKVLNFVFSAKIGILLIHSGGNQIQPFFFRSQSFDKIAKFTIDTQLPLDIKNLFVTRIHEKSYCIYGDNQNIFIFELNIETVYKIRSIKLLLAGHNSIHFVDNLIIVHSEHKVSMVYDLKMIQKDRDVDNKKDEFPISAIPMGLKDITGSSSDSSNSNSSNGKLNNLNGSYDISYQKQSQQLYLKDWEYIHPNYIFEKDTGNWYEVSLNFNTISNFLQFDSHKTIPFLQDRTLPNAKQALLSLIKSIIECKSETLEGIGKIFDELNKVLFQTLNRNNTELLQKQLTINNNGGGSIIAGGSGNITPNTLSTPSSPSGSSLTLDQKLARSYLYNQGSGLNMSNSISGKELNGSMSLLNNSSNGNGNGNSSGNTSPKDQWKYSNPSTTVISNSNLILSKKAQLANSTNGTIVTNNNNSGGNQDDESDTFNLIGGSENFNYNNRNNNSSNKPIGTSSLDLQRGTTANRYKTGVSGSSFIPTVRASRSPQYILINSIDMYEKVLYPIYEKILTELDNNSSSNSNSNKDNNSFNSGSGSNLNINKQSHKERIQMDYKYLISIITEYIRSLSFSFCPTSDKIYDLLISLFVDNNMFSQLHQYLQYYGIQDSDNVAYKLLSIGERYPPALQLSLDMFKRLHKPNIIISTLLERKQLLPAIRLLRSIKDQDQDLYLELLTPISVSLFLKEASTQNDLSFFSVFKYFENNNHINPSNPIFDRYIKIFLEKFGSSSHLIYLKKTQPLTSSALNTDSLNNSRSNSPKLISNQSPTLISFNNNN